MRLVLTSATLLLLAPTLLTAQHARPAEAQVVRQNPANTCPVDLAVGRHADGTLMPADGPSSGTQTHQWLGLSQTHQWLDLSMKNTEKAPIVSAELDVHGTENAGRVVSAAPSGATLRMDEPAGDAVRHVHLDSRVAAAGSWDHLLAIEGLTSVSSVEITELRYADGSRWHPSAGQSCRVQPDPLMLIAGR